MLVLLVYADDWYLFCRVYSNVGCGDDVGGWLVLINLTKKHALCLCKILDSFRSSLRYFLARLYNFVGFLKLN